MSQFWHLFVIGVSLVSLVSYIVFVMIQSKTKSSVSEDESTGHYWDGITELNKPLPKWWFYSFIGLCIWAIGFAFYYPALGNMKGIGKWTQENQYEIESQKTDALYSSYYKGITDGSIEEISKNKNALDTGRRLFLNNCAVCHASDAAGFKGYPNLTDSDWLYGGDANTILTSIKSGRNGLMPPQREILETLGKTSNIAEPVNSVAEYVLSLSGITSSSEKTKKGEGLYKQVCIACHGPEGKGNHALGAPNLTDNIWLYIDIADSNDASIVKESIVDAINKGHAGKMPSHKEILSEEKLKVLAAYVYSLSNN